MVKWRRGKRVTRILANYTLHAPFQPGDTVRPLAPPGSCSLYRFYDSQGDLLYVGVAWNPGRRWEHHRRTAAWWREATRAVVAVYDCQASALSAERAWIRNAQPRFNVRSTA